MGKTSNRDLSLELFSKCSATKKNPFGGSISRLSISQPCSLIDRDFSNDDSSINNLDSINNYFNNKTDEDKLKSLSASPTPPFVDINVFGNVGENVGEKVGENVTSVEVSWASKDDKVSAGDDDEMSISLSEEERKRDRSGIEEVASEKDSGSVVSCSSVPVDFGDSLPPNLTTLVNKRFCLYRLNKADDTELGVLITKKLNRDRRTSGKF